jgi:uncharacterized Tic20 family protein
MTQNHDERTLAALAHASILLNLFTGVGGLAVAAGLYLWGRERSPYLTQQAAQALFHQVRLLALTLGIGLVAPLLSGGVTAWCLSPLAALLWIGGMTAALRAGRACLQGRDFHYRWLGKSR